MTTTLKTVAMAAMLIPLVACDSGGGGSARSQTGAGTGGVSGSTPGATGALGGGDGRVPLVNWVDDLAENHNVQTDPPDTVEDKVAIIIDTDDPAAFDPLLQRQAPPQP